MTHYVLFYEGSKYFNYTHMDGPFTYHEAWRAMWKAEEEFKDWKECYKDHKISKGARQKYILVETITEEIV